MDRITIIVDQIDKLNNSIAFIVAVMGETDQDRGEKDVMNIRQVSCAFPFDQSSCNKNFFRRRCRQTRVAADDVVKRLCRYAFS